MKAIIIFTRIAIVFLFLLACSNFVGCEGSDTREAVDDTVEELTGKKNVERMKKMKKDIKKIEDQQSKRYDQLEDEK